MLFLLLAVILSELYEKPRRNKEQRLSYKKKYKEEFVWETSLFLTVCPPFYVIFCWFLCPPPPLSLPPCFVSFFSFRQLFVLYIEFNMWRWNKVITVGFIPETIIASVLVSKIEFDYLNNHWIVRKERANFSKTWFSDVCRTYKNGAFSRIRFYIRFFNHGTSKLDCTVK